ncbi:MAG TPA: DegT/DnrJ/EryC1/StrS family aminotransferase [Solirubrobacteraceae bacterium]|nr:DegT/DnrJ/EryC1/StrS family aminotransferase [Solirubrobacteraceae bacterium]
MTGSEAVRAEPSPPQIPLTRLDATEPELIDELLAAVRRVAESARFTLGDEVEAFEAEWAAHCGVAHAVGVSSGTDALALALRAVGVGAGDDVVVPANSFIATAEAVTLSGASPRFADVDPRTALVTAETVEAALTPRTRCVIPVHLYGRTVEMEPLMALARDRGVHVVEDACQAHGARLGPRRAGGIGDAGCFSFYPAKNLGAWGDAGAVVTPHAGVAERVRLLRSHGERSRHHHELVGTTARLDALQAAILRVKLRRLEEATAARRRAAASLRHALGQALTDLTGASAATPLTLPPAPAPGGDDVFHQFVVRCADRDGLRRHLTRRGIETAVHYPVPIHLTPAYAGSQPRSLPTAETLAAEILSLPIHPRLAPEEITRTAGAVATFTAGAGIEVRA